MAVITASRNMEITSGKRKISRFLIPKTLSHLAQGFNLFPIFIT